MSTDLRARYLSQRVMTATPAQRVVMLYDRLHLDMARAADPSGGPDAAGGGGNGAAEHVDHAMQIVAELSGSLNTQAGGPAENLASLYGYLLGELMAVRGGETARLAGAQGIVQALREAWTKAVASTAAAAAAAAASAGAVSAASGATGAVPVAAGGAWVG